MAFRPSHKKQKNTFTAKRTFKGRKEEKTIFKKSIFSDFGDDDYNVVTFYGAGGQGKTALCNELVNLIKIEDLATTSRFYSWAKVDFGNSNNRNIDEALLQIRLKLKRSGDIKFPAFDLAFSRYRARCHPGIDIRTQYPELFTGENEVIQDIVDIAGDFLSEIPGVSFIYKYSSKMNIRFKEWWERRGCELLKGIDELEEQELLLSLPKYLGADLYDYLHGDNSKENGRQITILFDTYEALWKGVNLTDGPSSTRVDKWIRNLVIDCPGVLFVVLGRDKLTWDLYDENWKKVIQQYALGALSKKDADEFLRTVPIDECSIREVIVESAKGLPFYLDLQVSLYEDVIAQGNTPVADMFGGTDVEIIARFLDHLNDQMEYAVRVLAQAPYFNEPIFNHLCKAIPGVATIRFEQITGQSFIEMENDQYRIHDLMKDYLFEQVRSATPLLFKDIHRSLFEWHDKIFKNEDSQFRKNFFEAATHLTACCPDELPSWCHSISYRIVIMGDNGQIRQVLRNSLEIAESRLEKDALEISRCQLQLGSRLRASRQYDKAEAMLKSALMAAMGIHGENGLFVAQLHYEYGIINIYLSEYDKGIKYVEKALMLSIDSKGIEHEFVSLVNSKLAGLYRGKDESKRIEALKIMLEMDSAKEDIQFIRIHKGIGDSYKELSDKENSIKHWDIAFQRCLESEKEINHSLKRIRSKLGQESIKSEALVNQEKVLKNKLSDIHVNTIWLGMWISLTRDDLGDICLKSGQPEKAIEYWVLHLDYELEDRREEFNEHGRIREKIGDAYLKLKDFQKAIDYWELALNDFMKTSDENYQRITRLLDKSAFYLSETDEFEKALRYRQDNLNLALKHNTEDIYIKRFKLAAVLYRLEKYEQAREQWQISLEIARELLDDEDTQCAIIKAKIGDSHHKLGDIQKATLHWESALKFGWQSPRVSRSLGRTYLGLGELEKAIDVLEPIWDKMEKPHETIEDIEYFLELLTSSSEGKTPLYITIANKKLGHVFYKSGDFVKAIESWERALGTGLLSKNDVYSVRGYLGGAWYKLGDFQKAIKYFEMTLEHCKSSQQRTMGVLDFIGDSWNQLGDKEKAMEFWQLALEAGLTLKDSELAMIKHLKKKLKTVP